MGNTCVFFGSRCFEKKSSLWVRPTDLIMAQPSGTQCISDFQTQNKPPEHVNILRLENAKVQPEPPENGEEEKKSPKLGGNNENPAAVTSNPRKAHNVIRLASAGLQAESVLKDVKGNLRDYYNLGNKLGQGQFGTTFLCIEKDTGEEYACKSIAKRKLVTEEDVEDVRREIEIMHHLAGQPNVIRIKRAFEDSVSIHVVMELCKGGELFDRIVARGHYTERKAVELARVIVGVVQNCHSLGVMHRDLKPENFLFVNELEDCPLKAIDFGLSVFFNPDEIFGDMVGSPYYVAPEVLLKSYGPEADVWSAGVMIYALLSGEPPFCGETEEEIFEEVLNADLDLSSDPWPEISESAKDLIRKMLDRNPKTRLSAQQVLCHPWILDEGIASDKPLDSAVLTRLKQFSAMNKLKKMALRVIAQSLSEEEIGVLKEIFETIDTDKSGQISYEELKEGIKRSGANVAESEIQSLMQAADVDNNGGIDYEEFIAATLQLNRITQREDEEDRHFVKAFSYFDKDGSGFITHDEIQTACEELGMNFTRIDELIEEIDRDKDGRIDYSEFVEMMQKDSKE